MGGGVGTTSSRTAATWPPKGSCRPVQGASSVLRFCGGAGRLLVPGAAGGRRPLLGTCLGRVAGCLQEAAQNLVELDGATSSWFCRHREQTVPQWDLRGRGFCDGSYRRQARHRFPRVVRPHKPARSVSLRDVTHCALEGGFPNWDEFENPAKPPLPRGVNGAGFPCDSLAGFLRGAPMLPSLQELGGRTLLSPVQGASKVTGSSFT